MTRQSALRTAAIVLLVALVYTATPTASLAFENSSLWRERHLGHHRVQNAEEQQPDYYGILGVDRNAGPDVIKKAFRQLVKQYHPDANPNNDTTSQFQTINKAYQILSDPQRRQKYNGQTYNQGMSNDTPHFIIDALESDSFQPKVKNTANTDAVRYQPVQLEPNTNGVRVSLFETNDQDNEKNRYRIRSY